MVEPAPPPPPRHPPLVAAAPPPGGGAAVRDDTAAIIPEDLPPQEAGLRWYGLRMWRAAGLRDLKRLGWPWERTRRTTPTRVARPGVVLAVATTGVLRHGGLPADVLPSPRSPTHPPVSAFPRGRFRFLGLLLGTHAPSDRHLLPPPWPDHAAVSRHITRWPHPPSIPGAARSPPGILPVSAPQAGEGTCAV